MCVHKTRLQEINASISHKQDYLVELKKEVLQLENELVSLAEEKRYTLQKKKESVDV